MKFAPIVTKLFYSCVFAVGLFVCQNIFAQQMVTPPPTVIVEGVPSLPKLFENEFKNSTDWKTSSFLGWKQSENEIIGYSEYYKPFFIKSALKERVDFNIFLPEPQDFAIQPVSEKTFLYSKDNDGDENTQIYKYDLETRQPIQLTNFPEIEYVNSRVWSPDGKLIYFVNQKKKENIAEIFQLNPENKEKKKLLTLKGDTHFIVDIDSQNLLISHYLSNNYTIYYLFDLNTSQISELTRDKSFFKKGKFSKKKRGIWWLSDSNSNFFNIYYYDLGKRISTKVNRDELNITDYALSQDENFLALKINNFGAENIRIFEIKDSQIIKEIDSPKLEPGVIEKISWSKNDELGFGYESLKTPSEIRSFDVKTGIQQTWGKGVVNKNIVDQIQDARVIKWPSFDGKQISGLILTPKQKDLHEKFPVIIDIHGGPKDQYQPYFNSYRIYSVARLQSAIIFPNIRGSSGFGKEFENLDNKDKREDALKDLQALLDWIKTQPDLDANRVIVKGTSYGAFMALALGIKEQNRLKGVIAEVPPVSIKNYINKSVKSLQDIYAFEYGLTTDEELMAKTESLSLLKKINLDEWKLPVLLTAGQNDVRVPLEDIEKLKNELKARGVPVWYLKATNEGHFWSEYDNNVYLELSKIAFFIKYTN